MKNHIIIIALLVLAAAGCKKDSAATAPAKDYSLSVKGNIWTGDFTYTGRQTQPVSIEFNANGNLTWHELANDFTGTWAVNGNNLSVTSSNGGGFKATISDDDKLTGIQTVSGSAYGLNDAVLQTQSATSPDNTIWKGTNIKIAFKPGHLLDLTLGASITYSNLTYTQAANTIRFNALPAYKWFIITNTAFTMTGSNQFLPDATVYAFQLTN